MGYVPNHRQVYQFLQDPAHSHGTVSYNDWEGQPHGAWVAFSATSDLEIIFGTSDTTRKYGHIKHHDLRVGFTVADTEQRLTVQIAGEANEINGRELDAVETDHYAKLGESSRRFRSLPDQHFFLIKPKTLRFSDCRDEPWTVTEFRF